MLLIFCFPSELEGMPLAVMEAMARDYSIASAAGIERMGDTGKLLTDPKVAPQVTVTG